MQTLPSPANCCDPCDDQATTQIPGAQGLSAYQVAVEEGFVGTEAQWLASLVGDDGLNAYTVLTAQFTQPAVGATAIATVASSGWAVVGEDAFMEGGGYYEVTAIADSTHVTLRNRGYTANSPPTTVIPIGSRLAPAGEKGTAGASGGGDLLAANNLNDVDSAASSRTNLGLGTAAVVNTGVANTLVPIVDDAAGLTNGEAVFATAAGLETKTAANSRTALGLGTMAVQNAASVAITGGAMNGTLGATTPAAATVTTLSTTGNATLGSKLFLTSSAVQSLLAATPINPNAVKVRVAGNGGAVTLTAVPTITTPAADGQLLIIQGNDGTNTVTLQDEASLAGSQLELGAATRLLGLGDMIGLLWDSATSKWYELFFTNN